MPVCRPDPGVLLIAHEANYSLDCNTNRLSLLYNRKATGSGTPQEHLSQAYDSAVAACRRFVQEPEFRSKLEFDFDDVELIFNDRLLHPNTEAGWQEIQLDVKQFFDGIFGSNAYTLTRATDPRERLRLNIRKKRVISLQAIRAEIKR